MFLLKLSFVSYLIKIYYQNSIKDFTFHNLRFTFEFFL